MELEGQPATQVQSPMNIGVLSPMNVDTAIETDTSTPFETHTKAQKGIEIADPDAPMLEDNVYSPSESYHSKHSIKSNYLSY